MVKFEERDFSKYEGKEIICLGKPAVVDGCDYDIGITISDKYDKADRFICLVNSKNVKTIHINEDMDTPGDYRALFALLIYHIKKGRIDDDKFTRKVRSLMKYFYKRSYLPAVSESVPASRCAFSQ